MANYVIYTRPDESEIQLKMTASRAVELEERLGASIPDKLKELDRLSVAAEFLAAAIPGGDHKARKQTALDIYDEMIERGGTIQEYQFLVTDILVKAGFLNGKAVEAQKEMIKVSLEQSEKLLAENLKALQSK